MEDPKNLISEDTQLLPAVLEKFFRNNSPDTINEILWYIFKAWVNSPEANRTRYSDEEIASFLDQLIDLMAAAYILHQANRAPGIRHGGNEL